MISLLVALFALIAAVLPPAQVDGLTPGYWEQTPLPQTGLATFYAPGMMEHVLDVRDGHGQMLRCPECVGTVALLRAGDIGRKVWLQPPGGEKIGPFLVIDCARQEDVWPLVDRNWVVDVSYELGELWGMNRPLDDVTVLADPSDESYSGVIDRPATCPHAILRAARSGRLERADADTRRDAHTMAADALAHAPADWIAACRAGRRGSRATGLRPRQQARRRLRR